MASLKRQMVVLKVGSTPTYESISISYKKDDTNINSYKDIFKLLESTKNGIRYNIWENHLILMKIINYIL